MTELKRTPLFNEYAELGGKPIDFGGWALPVQFSSIAEEHEAVRTGAGLFDVSHMGEFTVQGACAGDFLQSLLTNDIAKMKVGKAQYNIMCYPDGGTVDDLIVYKRAEDDYFICVNAANIDKDFAWMEAHKPAEVVLENCSDKIGQVALQGPLAISVLQKLTATDLSAIPFFGFRDGVSVDGVSCTIARTGYTGEDGFELYAASEEIAHVWRAILDVGRDDGVIPCGLGARDTLRFEACLPLYGQELSPAISPVEAGVGFAVKTEIDADFIGKSVLKSYKTTGAPRKMVGIEMTGRGIPRHGYPVFVGDEPVGIITTGTQVPLTKRNIGMSIIKTAFAEIDQVVSVEIRGKKIPAVVVATPFYKRERR